MSRTTVGAAMYLVVAVGALVLAAFWSSGVATRLLWLGVGVVFLALGLTLAARLVWHRRTAPRADRLTVSQR